MTLNPIALILRYFTEFDSFGGRLRYSGLDRPAVMSAECRFPLLAKTLTLQRGFSAIAELLL